MAATSVTIKLTPGEYETLKSELADQLETVQLSYKSASAGPAKHGWGQRAARLESLIKQL